jgi:hypothetical protein
MRTPDGLSLQSDAGRALSSPTIVELFREQVVRLAARTALRQPVAVGEQYHDLIEQMYAEGG